jgi:O-antigen ligase
LETVVRPSLAKEVGFGNRKEVAVDSLRIVRDHPWVGTGLGSFKTVYAEYQSFPDDSLWDHAHNDYAEALAETGLIGGGLTVLAILLFLSLSFRGLLDRLTHGSGWMALGGTLGGCGLLVHTFFDFNFHLPANALWFAFCLALSTCGPGSVRSDLANVGT